MFEQYDASIPRGEIGTFTGARSYTSAKTNKRSRKQKNVNARVALRYMQGVSKTGISFLRDTGSMDFTHLHDAKLQSKDEEVLYAKLGTEIGKNLWGPIFLQKANARFAWAKKAMFSKATSNESEGDEEEEEQEQGEEGTFGNVEEEEEAEGEEAEGEEAEGEEAEYEADADGGAVGEAEGDGDFDFSAQDNAFWNGLSLCLACNIVLHRSGVNARQK
jgi:hypothetical protein